MKAVVDAVRYCHELKIVHRDIKVFVFWYLALKFVNE